MDIRHSNFVSQEEHSASKKTKNKKLFKQIGKFIVSSIITGIVKTGISQIFE